MAQIRGRGRGGFSSRGRGSRGRGAKSHQKRSDFKTSRLADPDELQDQRSGESTFEGSDRIAEDATDSASSEDEQEQPQERAYSALLQSLNASGKSNEPSRKKRKLNGDVVGVTERDVDAAAAEDHKSDSAESDEDEAENDLADAEPDEGSDIEVDDQDADDIEDASDPFESHFANPDEKELSQSLDTVSKKSWRNWKRVSKSGLRQVFSMPSNIDENRRAVGYRNRDSLKLKKRLSSPAKKMLPNLDALEQDLAAPTFAYEDTVFGGRTPQNGETLRHLVTLHALNHVFKTRDRVLKNNARLSRNEDEDLDLRDQGFTRPKILFLLPTKNSCLRVVESITALCEPEQQENKSRFLESFTEAEDKPWDDKPADFRELFAGNDDDMFRIGLKFTRKNMKYFSQFYASDIILASPLGLRTAIDKDDGKKHDHDFLSSIEVVIVDQADALLMQNWEHVEYIFSQLNLLPKEPHGCDFSRVRNWYLDGHAKHLRQTIVLSAFITPELNALYSTHMLNVTGRVRLTPATYPGTLTLPTLAVPILKQTFSRFASPSPSADPDARFAYFTSAILPSILKQPQRTPSSSSGGSLIFIPSYLDFVHLRNHLAQSTNLSFGAISEYTSVRDVARARSHFLSGRHALLLYTERAHHFRRYARIRGVSRVVMYGVPENPLFWGEVVGYLGLGEQQNGGGGAGGGSVRAMFSKWDVLKLERVVGTARVGAMVREGVGDTFDFV